MRLALAVLASLVFAAPALAQGKEQRWKAVLAERDSEPGATAFTLTTGSLTDAKVVVRIRAREEIAFPDPLYGATAWKWTGRTWRRVDSAEVRPTEIVEMAPGERAKVVLPLTGTFKKVRVLFEPTPGPAGRWIDVP